MNPPQPDYSSWKLWIDIAQFAVTAVIGFYIWIVNTSKATNKRIGEFQDDVDGRFDTQSERLTRVETKIEHMPGAISIGKVHKRLDDLASEMGETRGAMKGVKDSMSSMNSSLDMVVQTLLEREKK